MAGAGSILGFSRKPLYAEAFFRTVSFPSKKNVVLLLSQTSLVRAELNTTAFGHFVVITGFENQGQDIIIQDSYPGEHWWNSTTEERRRVGKDRRVDWYKFEESWSSNVDPDDPHPSAIGPHVRWAMSNGKGLATR